MLHAPVCSHHHSTPQLASRLIIGQVSLSLIHALVQPPGCLSVGGALRMTAPSFLRSFAALVAQRSISLRTVIRSSSSAITIVMCVVITTHSSLRSLSLIRCPRSRSIAVTQIRCLHPSPHLIPTLLTTCVSHSSMYSPRYRSVTGFRHASNPGLRVLLIQVS